MERAEETANHQAGDTGRTNSIRERHDESKGFLHGRDALAVTLIALGYMGWVWGVTATVIVGA